MRREMHDRVDIVRRENALEEISVAGLADDQLAGRHGLAESRAEIVERDDVFAGRAELPHHVAANVPGSAGYKYLFVSHAYLHPKCV